MHKRSHNQVIKIEICDIYLYRKYVRAIIPLGGVGNLAGCRVAGSSPAVGFIFFSSLSPPSFHYISLLFPFPFMLVSPLQCSSIFLVSILSILSSHVHIIFLD